MGARSQRKGAEAWESGGGRLSMELPALDHAGSRSFSLVEAKRRGRGEASREVDGRGGEGGGGGAVKGGNLTR